MWQELKDEVRDGVALFDAETGSWINSYRRQGGQVFCGKGCRDCCNLAVNATLTEVLCIAERMTAEQDLAVRAHVQKLLLHSAGVTDLRSFLRLHRQEVGLCPLLDAEGGCGVYACRPFACRALLATRESRFCRIDFSILSPVEKEAFVAALDTSVVAFPMHYVAATAETGREHEGRAIRRMQDRFGFAVYGNLPVLLYLERYHLLSSTMEEGEDAARSLCVREGFSQDFLITFAGRT